jgi:TatD DNase family protein
MEVEEWLNTKNQIQIDIFNNKYRYNGESFEDWVKRVSGGDAELARKYISMGFYISIAGPVTYNSAYKLKQVAKEIPLEYLLVETDSPCLTPSAAGRKRNEPLYVRYVASMVAELKGISYEKVEARTNENAKRLFRIAV